MPIEFECTFDQNKRVISVDGDGAATIMLTADATQLAGVLTSLTELKGCRIKCMLERLPEDYQNGQNKPQTHK